MGKIIHGNTCHSLVTKESSIFSARRSTSFRILCCALGRFSKPPIERCMGTKIGMVNIFFKITETLTESTASQWNNFPGFNTLQLSEEVKRLLLKLDETPENFVGRILFMSMFNNFSCGSKDNEKECLANAKLVSLYARRFGKGHWSFVGPGSEKRYCISEDTVHKEYGTILLKGCWWNSQKADAQFSALQAHCPEVDSKAKDMENCRYTMQPIWKRLRLFFA